MDRQIDELAFVVKKVYDHGNGRLAKLRRQRNRLLPFHQLPHGIMHQIIWLILPDVILEPQGTFIGPNAAAHFTQLHVLAQVCHSWAHFIKKCPDF